MHRRRWKLIEEYDTGRCVCVCGGLMIMATISHQLAPGRATSGSWFLICPDNTSSIFSDLFLFSRCFCIALLHILGGFGFFRSFVRISLRVHAPQLFWSSQLFSDFSLKWMNVKWKFPVETQGNWHSYDGLWHNWLLQLEGWWQEQGWGGAKQQWLAPFKQPAL